jgi:hypothetical protein
MTAIIQPPVDALLNSFDKLSTSLTGSTAPGQQTEYNKVKLDEKAKKVRLLLAPLVRLRST